MITTVTVWPESAGETLRSGFQEPSVQPLWKSEGVFLWTEGQAEFKEPQLIILNTKAKRTVYRKPVLVSAYLNSFLFSAFTEPGESGTLRHIEQVYIQVSITCNS